MKLRIYNDIITIDDPRLAGYGISYQRNGSAWERIDDVFSKNLKDCLTEQEVSLLLISNCADVILHTGTITDELVDDWLDEVIDHENKFWNGKDITWGIDR